MTGTEPLEHPAGEAAVPPAPTTEGASTPISESPAPAGTATLIETIRQGIPDDYLGPDPNDPTAGERWGPNPAVVTALDDLARRVAELEAALREVREAICSPSYPVRSDPPEDAYDTPMMSRALRAIDSALAGDGGGA